VTVKATSGLFLY